MATPIKQVEVSTDIKNTNKIDPSNISNPPNLTILKNLLLEIKTITHSLSSTENNLRQNIQNISEENWKIELEKIDIQKSKLDENLEIIEDPTFIKKSARCVSKRKLKRLAIKAKRKEYKERIKNNAIKRNNLHLEIDNMLKDIENENKKQLQKKAQIKESESILSDVKSRISQARHWLAIIEPLKELRGLRNQAAIARGEKLSSVHHENFNDIMDKLKEIWEYKLEHYTKEEQELKKTLNIYYEKTFQKTYEEDWNRVLFGDDNSYEVNNLQDFIGIRSCWDQFIVPPNDSEGSKIPIGYVMPVEASSDLWRKYLINE